MIKRTKDVLIKNFLECTALFGIGCFCKVKKDEFKCFYWRCILNVLRFFEIVIYICIYITSDIGIDKNFFHNLSFMYYNHQVKWLRILRYSEDIMHWRRHTDVSSSSTNTALKIGAINWEKHKEKYLRCSAILVNFRDNITRLTPHGFVQNTGSFIQSPGNEILWKRLVTTDFQKHRPKICSHCVHGKLPYKIFHENARISHVVLVIPSIFCMNYTETNLQEHLWGVANDSLWHFSLLDL